MVDAETTRKAAKQERPGFPMSVGRLGPHLSDPTLSHLAHIST